MQYQDKWCNSILILRQPVGYHDDSSVGECSTSTDTLMTTFKSYSWCLLHLPWTRLRSLFYTQAEQNFGFFSKCNFIIMVRGKKCHKERCLSCSGTHLRWRLIREQALFIKKTCIIQVFHNLLHFVNTA